MLQVGSLYRLKKRLWVQSSLTFFEPDEVIMILKCTNTEVNSCTIIDLLHKDHTYSAYISTTYIENYLEEIKS